MPNFFYSTDTLGGLPCSLSLILSPLSYIVSSKIQTRWTCILGVLISSSALAMTSLVTENLVLLFVVYGCMFGLGASFLVNPPFFLVNEYFPYNHPRHVLTTSLAACAFPLGSCIYIKETLGFPAISNWK